MQLLQDPFIPNAGSNMWEVARTTSKHLQQFMWEKGLYVISINLPDSLSMVAPQVSQRADGTIAGSRSARVRLVTLDTATRLHVPFPPIYTLTVAAIAKGQAAPSEALIQRRLAGPGLPAAAFLNPATGPDVREIIVVREVRHCSQFFHVLSA